MTDAVAVHAVVVIDLIGRAEHRELVRHADALEAALIARLAEHLGHSAAKTAVDRMILDGDHIAGLLRDAQNGVGIERFDRYAYPARRPTRRIFP